jgi:membrane protein YdbS with pleckstrin-like domain
MWPAGPGHWIRIAALLTVALLTNILLIFLLLLRLQVIRYTRWRYYSEERDVATMLVVALVGGFLILLGTLWQKRSIEQGK